MSTTIQPFRIAVGDDVLDDLKSRLRKTRWPEAELVDDWSQGVPLKWIEEVCRYWADDYDWRSREALLNRFAQFTTEIDGLDIHFLHVRSPHPEAMPLIITHGWPGSIVEFHKVIEPLADPTAYGGDAADAFHVVCPSLPGFGFSAKPTTTGWGVDRIAGGLGRADGSPRLCALRRAGRRLGLRGDDGARRAGRRALRRHPHHARDVDAAEGRGAADTGGGAGAQGHQVLRRLGFRLLQAAIDPAADPRLWPHRFAGRSGGLDPGEVLGVDRLRRPSREHSRPRRAARQRHAVLGDRRRRPRRRGSIGRASGRSGAPRTRSPCRPASRSFPRRSSRRCGGGWKASFTNIRHWNEMPKGGHFAAFEQPELFVGDVRDFFRSLR